MFTHTRSLAVVAVVALASAAYAVEPGKAAGTLTFDTTTVQLAHATSGKAENLFDDKKSDVLVVLSDKPLGATAPDDDIDLSLRARKGEIAAIMLRIDGARLVNVSIFHKGLAGKVILPGAWFQYAAAKPGAGTVKMAARDFEGHKYATSVEFAAAAPQKAAEPTPVVAAPVARPGAR